MRTAKRAAREAKAAERTSRRDRIVEAPREPKKSMGERLRRDPTKTPPAPKDPNAPKVSAARRAVSLLGVLLGVLGLICSIILAVGALLAAKGVDETGSFYETISGMCDALAGPLRDVFSFEGANAEMKESLVAWGAGSIIYLLAGLIAQTVLRSAADD